MSRKVTFRWRIRLLLGTRPLYIFILTNTVLFLNRLNIEAARTMVKLTIFRAASSHEQKISNEQKSLKKRVLVIVSITRYFLVGCESIISNNILETEFMRPVTNKSCYLTLISLKLRTARRSGRTVRYQTDQTKFLFLLTWIIDAYKMYYIGIARLFSWHLYEKKDKTHFQLELSM